MLLDAGWALTGLRAFDLYPMTEHVELVALLEPPGTPRPQGSMSGPDAPKQS